MNRTQKEQQVAELREAIETAPAVVLAASVGMSANDVNELRSKLFEAGVTYKVVKNTLAKRAVAGTEFEAVADHFVGPTAIAFHPEEPSTAAKVLVEFAKTNDALVLKAGALGTTILDEAGVAQLAKMPGKNELRSMLLRVFMAQPTKFVRTLVAGPQSLLNVLNARRDSL